MAYKRKVWAFFDHYSEESPLMYVGDEITAEALKTMHSDMICIPFRVSLKQWNALFSTGRIVWANIVADVQQENNYRRLQQIERSEGQDNDTRHRN